MKRLLALSFSLLMLASCSEDTMDSINNNENNPLNAPSKFIMPELATSTAFSTVGGDFSLYASIYMEHEAGIHNQLYNAETRLGEPSNSTTYNNVWEGTYSNIKNAKLIIKKCSKGGQEEGNEITLAMAKVYLAYNAAVLTDMFGDIPYTQAGELTATGLPVFMQPSVDKQADVYADIFKQLDEALVLFEKGADTSINSTPIGGSDYIYGGNKLDMQKALWIKAIYALKARYTMRNLAKSADKNADLRAILTYVDKSFASLDEEFKYAKYDGDAVVNPLGAFSYSRDALAASQSLVKKLHDRKDPRLTQVFMDYNGVVKTKFEDIVPAPNGTVEQMQYTYDITATIYSFEGATMLMSYHELMFVKAEAHARLNELSKAEVALKNGIVAGLANLKASSKSVYGAFFGKNFNLDVEFTTAEIDKYFTNNVKPLFTANPLSEIAVQKYLSFLGASGESVEAFNDYRRHKALGENFVILENPKNSDRFPLRFVYGNSDVLANPNIKALTGDGSYVYKEQVWWAGGTR